jgi:hypothetical protein
VLSNISDSREITGEALIAARYDLTTLTVHTTDLSSLTILYPFMHFSTTCTIVNVFLRIIALDLNQVSAECAAVVHAYPDWELVDQDAQANRAMAALEVGAARAEEIRARHRREMELRECCNMCLPLILYCMIGLYVVVSNRNVSFSAFYFTLSLFSFFSRFFSFSFSLFLSFSHLDGDAGGLYVIVYGWC